MTILSTGTLDFSWCVPAEKVKQHTFGDRPHRDCVISPKFCRFFVVFFLDLLDALKGKH